jgi:hypothetical protein
MGDQIAPAHPRCIVSGCTDTPKAHSRCDRHRAALRRHDPRFLAQERERKFRARYGISTDEAEAIFAQHDYTCWVCACPWEESHNGLTIDHDAITGIVRGALCQGCNTGIGQFMDDVHRMFAAINYLNRAATLRLDCFGDSLV